jgi:hypothetical protein
MAIATCSPLQRASGSLVDTLLRIVGIFCQTFAFQNSVVAVSIAVWNCKVKWNKLFNNMI